MPLTAIDAPIVRFSNAFSGKANVNRAKSPWIGVNVVTVAVPWTMPVNNARVVVLCFCLECGLWETLMSLSEFVFDDCDGMSKKRRKRKRRQWL